MEISDDALAYLGEAGFDPIYGARPLKRAIQQHLEDALAKDLLEGKYAPGDTIQVGLVNGELGFSRK